MALRGQVNQTAQVWWVDAGLAGMNAFRVKSSHVQESFNLHATIYISKTIYTPELR